MLDFSRELSEAMATGRLPECRAPISFTSVISKECVFTRTDTSYLPPEDA